MRALWFVVFSHTRGVWSCCGWCPGYAGVLLGAFSLGAQGSACFVGEGCDGCGQASVGIVAASSCAGAAWEGNGFGHAQVAQIQRARILSAMFDVASEQGAARRERRGCRGAFGCFTAHVL